MQIHLLALCNPTASSISLTSTLAAPTIDLLAISDRGESTTDDITNETLPEFSIDLPAEVIAGNIVHFYIDGVEFGTGHVLTSEELSGGTFNFGLDPFTDDTYAITCTVENASGESAHSNTITYVVDTSLGATTLALAAGGLTTSDTTPTMRVTNASAVENDVAEVRAADGTVLGTKTWDATDESNGDADVTLSELTEDDHVLTAYVYGTASGSGAGTFSEEQEETLTVAAGLTLAYIDHAVDASNTNIYTFSALDFGSADAARHIVVGYASRESVAGPGTAAISSVTIGGVTATLVASNRHIPSDGADLTGFAIAAVPTGTTGDVVVTFSTTVARCGIVWWRAVGLGSATPTDTGISVADPATDTLTVAAGGFILAIALNTGGTGGSWSNVTQRLASTSIESTVLYTAADEISAGGGSVSPSFDWTTTTAFMAASFASWEP